MYKPANRNFNKVQYEELRKKVDPKFNQLHDELSALYYDEWKKGDFTNDFQGYKPANKEEAKELFDKLHGLIHHLQAKALYDENEKQAEKNQKLKQSMEREREDPQTGEKKPSKIQKTTQKIQDFKTEGIEITV